MNRKRPRSSQEGKSSTALISFVESLGQWCFDPSGIHTIVL